VLLLLFRNGHKPFSAKFICSAIHCATGDATPLPHILYLVVSLLVLPSARCRVWLSGQPINRSHSTGVSRRTCIVGSPCATNGTLFPPVPILFFRHGVISSSYTRTSSTRVPSITSMCGSASPRFASALKVGTIPSQMFPPKRTIGPGANTITVARLSPVLSKAFKVGHTPPSIHVS